MPKRGDQARQNVTQTIINAFQTTGNFVAVQDRKIYVTAKDGENNEIIQFAISITMPKTPISTSVATPSTDNSLTSVTPVDISPSDQEKIQELKKKLGIIP